MCIRDRFNLPSVVQPTLTTQPPAPQPTAPPPPAYAPPAYALSPPQYPPPALPPPPQRPAIPQAPARGRGIGKVIPACSL
eukprot:710119-Rhodomonas_salina.1